MIPSTKKPKQTQKAKNKKTKKTKQNKTKQKTKQNKNKQKKKKNQNNKTQKRVRIMTEIFRLSSEMSYVLYHDNYTVYGLRLLYKVTCTNVLFRGLLFMIQVFGSFVFVSIQYN